MESRGDLEDTSAIGFIHEAAKGMMSVADWTLRF